MPAVRLDGHLLVACFGRVETLILLWCLLLRRVVDLELRLRVVVGASVLDLRRRPSVACEVRDLRRNWSLGSYLNMDTAILLESLVLLLRRAVSVNLQLLATLRSIEYLLVDSLVLPLLHHTLTWLVHL